MPITFERMTPAEYAGFVEAWCARTCGIIAAMAANDIVVTHREMSAQSVAKYRFGLELRMSLADA